MTKNFMRWLCSCSLVCPLLGLPGKAARAEDAPVSRTISFTQGKWEESQWKSVRMVNQDEPRVFTQNADSLGVTKASFRKDDYNKESDNALLLTDTGTTEGEIAVTLRMGEGFNVRSSPGIVVCPEVVDGVMTRGIGVFVAHYGLAVWMEGHDEAKKRVTYCHLGQLARWNDPEAKHVLRCRYSKKQRMLAFKIDDSDVLVLCFVGDTRLSKIDLDINSVVGIWGCHGDCEFYEVKIEEGGSLPFYVRTKPEKE